MSAEKTRDMLRLVHECQDAGVNTLQMLYDQGEQLNRTEVTLDEIDEDLGFADSTLNNIERIEKMHICCVPCTHCFQKHPEKKSKQTGGKNDRLQDSFISASKSDIKLREIENQAVQFGSGQTDSQNLKNKFDASMQQQDEENIHRNLTTVSDHLYKLKYVATDMSTHVGKHNEQIDRMNLKAAKTHEKIQNVTNKTVNLRRNKKNEKNCCLFL